MTADPHALTDTRFRDALFRMVRRRVPESEAEDIVQASLTEALVAANAPSELDSMRRFVWGIARNKVADFYRHARHLKLEVPEMTAEDAPHTEEDLLRWVARALPQAEDAQQTLAWMLREAEGEDLAAIAEAENVPATRVRKRVSRMRQYLRARWAIELAAVAALGIVIAYVSWFARRDHERPIVREVPKIEPIATPEDRARVLRTHATEECAEGKWERCVSDLEDARKLDPAGDTQPEVTRMRDEAARNLAPPVVLPPESVPRAVPTPTSAPTTNAMPPRPRTQVAPSYGSSDMDYGSSSGPSPRRKP